ncbi:MAG: type II toxin-antitoxin system HipA family toxin [Acidiferrobacterales bacterium]|nr:type II toxin-antitoxin system HipA family toxin [Acidiferrobacterales bacterium]
MTDANVMLWGRRIGAVSWVAERDVGVFQYAPDFVGSGIQVAPLTMPLRQQPYEFPALSRATFSGLPGLLADSLPDKFGNALIDAWLARAGRRPDSFNPVERLCYIGQRGMGALEFEPVVHQHLSNNEALDVAKLVALANSALNQREQLAGRLNGGDEQQNEQQQIEDIIRVGTSAGGARAKAILAWNQQTGEFRSGQLTQQSDFTNWLIKFDGVSGNRDKELADPQGYGQIEYAYCLMALAAGIEMSECRLHHEGGRAHFMTKRFDRTDTGQKLHMQSLGAMMHFDFNQAGAYSYEQALVVINKLGLGVQAREQQFKRAVFNVLARNQDDHVKNIAYLMDKAGQWRLAPAYDMVYSFNPSGAWTGQHQMSINGKRDGFVADDLLALASRGDIKPKRAKTLFVEVADAVADWPRFAEAAGVSESRTASIQSCYRVLAMK